jgi:hypothetical protein
MPFKSLSAVHSVLLQGACLRVQSSHSIYNVDYRTQSWPSFPWRSPSSPDFSRWLLRMGSVWIVECAHTASRRRRSKCSTLENVRSVPRFCVPQNFRANPRAWSGGRSPERPRALSFGCFVCSGCMAFFCGLTEYSAGCLSAVPLPRRF